MTDETYREFAKDGITRFSRRPIDDEAWTAFAQRCSTSAPRSTSRRAFAALGARLDIIEHERGLTGNRIYYLAVPPSLFVPTVQELARARLRRPARSARSRASSSKSRSATTSRAPAPSTTRSPRCSTRRQIYRIDHYLGKETVQNILVLRFANSIFEPLFNQKYIDHVQITVAEEEGVGTRAGYYEQRRRAARHGAEPHPAAAGARRHGAAALARRRRRPRREARGDPVAAADGRGDASTPTSPVARHRYAGYRHARPRRRRRVAHRDLRRAAGRSSTTGAGPACRSSCAPASGCPSRASEIAIYLKEVPPILFNSDPGERSSRTCCRFGFSRTRASRWQSARRCPARASRSNRSRWISTTARAFGRLVAGGVRAPAARRHGRRPDPVHAAGRGRGRVALGDADPRALDDEERRRCRHMGPAPGDRPKPMH